MGDRAFLGTGMKFPPQIDSGTGRFALSTQEQSVRESVYLILMTNRGERWLEPAFGSHMMSYTFMDASATMMRMMSDDLRSLLLQQEPRISEVDVEIDPNAREGCLLISIRYTVAATNSHDNLVFPFYLNVTQEEDDL